ncbi:hypothetical protein WJX84_009465 [Apatococcus fuscideae]|uniref:Uncharacterized protein n=1 Tax=Apatococcus fuscideae TaxID=2026836 RepID=A0AAW1SZ51_9CHLO
MHNTFSGTLSLGPGRLHVAQAESAYGQSPRLPRCSVQCMQPGKEQHQLSMQEAAEKVLQNDPAARERLQRLGSAAARVAALQAAKEEIDQAAAAAAGASPTAARQQEQQQAQRAAARGRRQDVHEAQQGLADALREFKEAQLELQRQSSLVNQDLERIESGKAAAASGTVGLLASLPFIVAEGEPPAIALLSMATSLASGVLFGVVYRYALRQDTSNFQLKAGVVAAFGLVRGLAQAEAVLQSQQSSGSDLFSITSLLQAAIPAGQSMLLFGFAGAILDYGLRRGLLQPFRQGQDADPSL